MGMFLQPDWWDLAKPGVGTNRYAYSFGDPVNKMDPGGNEAFKDYDLSQEESDARNETLAREAEAKAEQMRTNPTLGDRISSMIGIDAGYHDIRAQRLRDRIGLSAEERKAYDDGEIDRISGIVGGTALGLSVRGIQTKTAAPAATLAPTNSTRVGRWMSKEEYDKMVKSGQVQEGSGGRTYVGTTPSPQDYTAHKLGDVYVEFSVSPTAVYPAGKKNWGAIPGPIVTSTRYGPAPTQPFSATDIVCRVGC